MFGSNEYEFPLKLLFTDRQVANLLKKSSALIKLLKKQISKIIEYSRFLCALFQKRATSLTKDSLPLAKNVYLLL